MRAVVLEMPEHWLEERRRQGSDRFDEVWDGVLHVVPPPAPKHQMFAGELEPILRPLAAARGWITIREIGLFGEPGENNYRVPDLVVVDPIHISERGVERRAEIAIEIRSPHDEAYEKLPFYRKCGVRETWILHPISRVFDIRSLDDGYVAERSRSEVLGIDFEIAPGPKLLLRWSGGTGHI